MSMALLGRGVLFFCRSSTIARSNEEWEYFAARGFNFVQAENRLSPFLHGLFTASTSNDSLLLTLPKERTKKKKKERTSRGENDWLVHDRKPDVTNEVTVQRSIDR